ncbi:unnamed protein product [Lota lota]
MASPAKVQKLDNEMSGYIHDVSPIKCSAKNTKYFTCVIQNDRDEYHKGVVFNPIKHREMEQAASHQTGIKLLDVKRTLSFNGNQSTADNYDILVNRQTSILVTNLPFPCKMPLQNRSMTLQQVAALQPFQRVGETNVKVVNVGCTDMVPIYGTLMEVQNCCVADQTAQIKQIGDVQAIEVHLVDSGPFDVEVNKSSVATKLTLSTNHNAPASVSGDSLAEDGLGLDNLFDCT